MKIKKFNDPKIFDAHFSCVTDEYHPNGWQYFYLSIPKNKVNEFSKSGITVFDKKEFTKLTDDGEYKTHKCIRVRIVTDVIIKRVSNGLQVFDKVVGSNIELKLSDGKTCLLTENSISILNRIDFYCDCVFVEFRDYSFGSRSTIVPYLNRLIAKSELSSHNLLSIATSMGIELQFNKETI